MVEPPTQSILSRARNEGYRDGLSQASMVHYDDAFYKGQCDVRAEAPSRRRWFLAGAFMVATIDIAVRMI